ncbi:MAG: magnesium transporter, partial [Elusimicrobia bacterium]|nr:magnesium transporter [Elusimicrobiota bacterium]
QVFVSDLKELLAAKEFISLRTALKSISPIELIEGWEHFTPDERGVLFHLMPRQRALQLFEELEPNEQEELLSALKARDVEELVADLDPAETGRLLRELPKPLVRQLEGIVRKGAGGARAAEVASYPEDSVGSLMRTRFLTISPRGTCREALARISTSTRLRFIENTFLETLFAVGQDDRLAGTVTLKKLVVAPADLPVAELLEPNPQVLTPAMDQEEGAKLFLRYHLTCAAVVDEGRRLLGVVLDRDMDEVSAEEVEEDFAKMAGMGHGLLSQSVFQITKLRLPWLIATCFGEVLVSWIVKQYEPTLAQVVALASFMPLIAAMGGNVGAQTATVVVRGLATGEIGAGEEGEAVRKEVGVGLLLGLVYGTAMGGVAHLFYGARFGWAFSLVVSVGMLVSMTVAATMGSIEPLFFRWAGIDPATATGPLITTFTDMVSTSSYLALATALLAHFHR